MWFSIFIVLLSIAMELFLPGMLQCLSRVGVFLLDLINLGLPRHGDHAMKIYVLNE